MNKIFYFFIYAVLYIEITLYIKIHSDVFIKKFKNKKIKLKLEKIKKLNNYIQDEIEITYNKNLKNNALS
jgi:hypothetical protein